MNVPTPYQAALKSTESEAPTQSDSHDVTESVARSPSESHWTRAARRAPTSTGSQREREPADSPPWPDEAQDDPAVTVHVVRKPDGSTFLVAIRNALPWVLRREYLLPEDLD